MKGNKIIDQITYNNGSSVKVEREAISKYLPKPILFSFNQ